MRNRGHPFPIIPQDVPGVPDPALTGAGRCDMKAVQEETEDEDRE
jgi:hypothetical protein